MAPGQWHLRVHQQSPTMNAYPSFPPSDLLHAGSQPPASERTRQKLTCRRVVEETPDVRTFVFSGDCGRPFDFKPGQYVTLHLNIGGAAVTRTYSVSSPPTRPFDLRITVKRVPGGQASNWLHDNLTAGGEVEIEGPHGRFNFDDLPSDKPLFLSGGSGITPVMSMLRALTDRGSGQDIRFIHSAHSADDIIFRIELDALDAAFPNLGIDCICSSPGADWNGPSGRLDGPMLLQLVPDLRERTIYACGPEPYMKAVRACLQAIGMRPAGYHEESFGGVEPAPLRAPSSDTAPSVHFSRSGLAHECANGETLLEAAQNCGLYIPTSCQQGVCGTCRTVKLSGDVTMDDLGGLTPEEKAAGYILLCCSRPNGAVSLDL
jgi:glycine betaine catabolism B